MAAIPSRRSRPLRSVPIRLGLLLGAGALAAGWAMMPGRPAAPAAVPLPEGKHLERLVFAGPADEVPTREGRLYDTLALFGLPPAEPRPWSAIPAAASAAADAGIGPSLPAGPAPRMAAIDSTRRSAEYGPGRSAARRAAPAPVPSAGSAPVAGSGVSAADREGVELFGWEVPGSRHIPTRRDAAQAVGHAGAKASDAGRSAASTIGRAASVLGDGLAGAGSAIASTLGWR